MTACSCARPPASPVTGPSSARSCTDCSNVSSATPSLVPSPPTASSIECACPRSGWVTALITYCPLRASITFPSVFGLPLRRQMFRWSGARRSRRVPANRSLPFRPKGMRRDQASLRRLKARCSKPCPRGPGRYQAHETIKLGSTTGAAPTGSSPRLASSFLSTHPDCLGRQLKRTPFRISARSSPGSFPPAWGPYWLCRWERTPKQALSA